MLNGKSVFVVMPGYRVARTLARTVKAIPREFVDGILFVDDGSDDGSREIARGLDIETFVHARNLGYGAAQKTLYREALARGADVVVMVHADFQYKPELVPAMASMIAFGGYDVVLGSRVLQGSALRGGMPQWKFVANRALTWTENVLTGASLTEYHTGYRAFARRVLEELPLGENGNDYVFDNEMLAQAIHFGHSIGEISCPAYYFPEMGTMSFRAGIRYGLGCLRAGGALALHRTGIARGRIFDPGGRKLESWREGVPLASDLTPGAGASPPLPPSPPGRA
jgi:glycosyltransferase involved in cell wall biosynthesis